MSRTRMIKPAFFKHAELYEAERDSGLPLRVAFAGLWTVTDRAGRFRWKVDLKVDVLPYDQVDILKVLAALEQYGFITSYVVDGKRYGFIPSFNEHQTFHKTERPSTLPAPLEHRESTVTYTPDTVADAVTGTVTGTVDQSVNQQPPVEAEPDVDEAEALPAETAEATLASRLASDRDRIALTAILAQAKSRFACCASISRILDGDDAGIGRLEAVQLGRALQDFAANGEQWNVSHFRGYVGRALKAPRSPPANSNGARDRRSTSPPPTTSAYADRFKS
ncbi:MAG: hypothetical protein ACHQWU_15530 [Gemmatimonadales bacterium]